MKTLSVIFAFLVGTDPMAARVNAGAQTPVVHQLRGHEAIAGIWVLNADKSDAPARGTLPDRAGPGQRSGGRGGLGGRGGFGGRGGGRRGGGGSRGQGGDSEQMRARMQATMNYMRTIMDASNRLTIVVHDTSVGITDADGQVLTLRTDDRKVDERAENGLVRLSRKSKWDASALVSEIEVENGPKITRRYELSPGGTELHIVTTLSGGFGGRGGGGTRAIAQVYERPLER